MIKNKINIFVEKENKVSHANITNLNLARLILLLSSKRESDLQEFCHEGIYSI
jgi:hypothetical protein